MTTISQSASKDTGSPEAQISIMTNRINQLAPHFSNNPNDKHSKVGLIRLVNTRKRLLKYLKRVSQSRYNELIKNLNLRDSSK